MDRTDPMPPATIGAHFSALVNEHDHVPPGRYGYDSARSCLFALLVARAPAKVHLPNYICSAVRQAVEGIGVLMQTYEIGPDFKAIGVTLGPNEVMILVNYFGLCAPAVEAQLTAAQSDAVVVDNSQAYFQAPFRALANIYSPRKFLPVPDGGFIETAEQLRQDHLGDAESLRRFSYLLQRVGAPPEATRTLYLASEMSLEGPSFSAMSDVTRAWIRAQDQNTIRARRRSNYRILARRFPNSGLNLEMGDQVPLCFPLSVGDGPGLHRLLLAERIFCPRYWPEVQPVNAFEASLIDRCVFLPIDHRYSESDMNRIADKVEMLKGKIDP